MNIRGQVFARFCECVFHTGVCQKHLVKSLIRLYVDVSYVEGATEVRSHMACIVAGACLSAPPRFCLIGQVFDKNGARSRISMVFSELFANQVGEMKW